MKNVPVITRAGFALLFCGTLSLVGIGSNAPAAEKDPHRLFSGHNEFYMASRHARRVVWARTIRVKS
jgi:hypothetical protein